MPAPTISNKRRKTNKEKEIMKCGHCGRMGHSRRTSFDCLQNPKRMAQDRAEEDTKQQAREKGTYIITILCDIELSMYASFFVVLTFLCILRKTESG